jgi:hypothetical protein
MLHVVIDDMCSASNSALPESTNLGHDDGKLPRLTNITELASEERRAVVEYCRR